MQGKHSSKWTELVQKGKKEKAEEGGEEKSSLRDFEKQYFDSML